MAPEHRPALRRVESPPVPPRPPASATRADQRRAPSIGRGGQNISQVGFSTATVAVPNVRATTPNTAAPNATAAAAATAPGAAAIAATSASAPANQETFATVACRAHNRHKLVPPPPPPKPQPPLTRQQFDAKFHTAHARSANKM
ncbi:hypothetical protein HDU82_004113, partial [Entophlyctis luteolus]